MNNNINMEVCHTSPSYIHKEEKKTPKNIQHLVIPEKFSKHKEFDLKRNFFDPNKSSPPNEFMIKLYKRFYHSQETDFVGLVGTGAGNDNSETFFDILSKK
jgi:hypothetical protein